MRLPFDKAHLSAENTAQATPIWMSLLYSHPESHAVFRDLFYRYDWFRTLRVLQEQSESPSEAAEFKTRMEATLTREEIEYFGHVYEGRDEHRTLHDTLMVCMAAT